jgi:hypothetical protein
MDHNKDPSLSRRRRWTKHTIDGQPSSGNTPTAPKLDPVSSSSNSKLASRISSFDRLSDQTRISHERISSPSLRSPTVLVKESIKIKINEVNKVNFAKPHKFF